MTLTQYSLFNPTANPFSERINSHYTRRGREGFVTILSVWPLVLEEIKAHSEEILQKNLSLGKRNLFSFTFSFRFCFCSCPHWYHCLKKKKKGGNKVMEHTSEIRARQEMPRGSVRKGARFL